MCQFWNKELPYGHLHQPHEKYLIISKYIGVVGSESLKFEINLLSLGT